MKAKKAPAKKRKRSNRRAATALPTSMVETMTQIARMRTAAAIVGQVLVHFGAGTGMPAQIFASPHVMRRFTNMLLTSTLAHLDILNWDTDASTRDIAASGSSSRRRSRRRSAKTSSSVYPATSRIRTSHPSRRRLRWRCSRAFRHA